MIAQEKTQGMILLDGLIEGRLSGDAAVETKLEKWVEFARTLGLKFNLDMSGSAFSVLPDNHPAPISRLGTSPEDAIRQTIEQLIGVLPEQDRASVFSTLRSAEYRTGEEVQSVYVIEAGGKVQVQSRSIAAKTIAPPKPVSTKERVKLALIGLFLALAIFGILMLFPPVREKFAEFIGSIKPVTVESVTITTTPFGDLIKATPKEFSAGARVLIITLERGKDYPTTEALLEEAYAKADTLAKKLALEAIAKGYVRVELIDVEGNIFAEGEFRIRELSTKESIELRVPVTAGEKKRKLERVEIRY